MNLITLSFLAPIVVINEAKPTVLHAASMESVMHGWIAADGVAPRMVGVCWRSGLRPLGICDEPVQWPPAVKSLPDGWSLCETCRERTRSLRPRSKFATASNEAPS